MTQKSKEVEAYLNNLTPVRQSALQTVRSLILDTIPGIEETMKYRMPTFKLDEVVCAFASQKNYMSLYMDTGLVEEYKPQLGGLDCGKSCIRFKKIEDLPLETIKQILTETVRRQQAQ